MSRVSMHWLAANMSNQRGPRMYPFVRQFYHPSDRVQRASREGAQRFQLDGRQYPADAYEVKDLAWKMRSGVPCALQKGRRSIVYLLTL